jgi:hypothetical protein
LLSSGIERLEIHSTAKVLIAPAQDYGAAIEIVAQGERCRFQLLQLLRRRKVEATDAVQPKCRNGTREVQR